jgi:SNF2 family DNA or RNA helicase
VSTLDPVQIAALDFARGKPGVGWFMEQGLGKTLTALADFRDLCKTAHADRMIVVCPNSFKRGWVDEVKKHGFKFHTHIYQSNMKFNAEVFLRRDLGHPQVFIINYEAIRRPSVLKAVSLWAKKGKTYLAIDESIQIKTPPRKSMQTGAVLHLAPLCAWVRLLSGRPQSNGPHDLWAQLRAIGLFPDTNFYAFRGAFCVMGGWQMKDVLKAQNEDILAKIMAPVVFQAKKRDWLPDLPRKDATIREYEMSGEQKRQYRQMESSFLLYLESGVVTVDVAIAKFEKLAQIQTGFIYDEAGISHELVEPLKNPRLQLLKEILDQEVEGKVCIVYRHKAVFDLLYFQFDLGERTAFIKGGMRPDDVEEQKLRFNTDPQCRIILLQAEAAKYGHTLLGGPGPDDLCRTMVFFENSYSADTRDQIEDRIHRRGQTGERVLYIDLSGSDLDRRIVKALQRKDALFKSVFGRLKEAMPA